MDDRSSDNRQMEMLVSRLYENERLTGALTDETARLVLAWGEQQLKQLGQVELSEEAVDQAGQALQRALRLLNRLVERRARLGEREMVEEILKLIDQVIFLTVTIQQGTTQEITHDQTT